MGVGGYQKLASEFKYMYLFLLLQKQLRGVTLGTVLNGGIFVLQMFMDEDC